MKEVEDKARYPRALALQVAAEVCRQLKPYCEEGFLKVCGSLRRGLSEVGDVEIVFVPRTEKRKVDFFAEADVDVAAEAIEWMVTSGLLAKRPNKVGSLTWGEKNKLALHCASGVPVDLFATTKGHWWITVVVRTGPARFNVKLIAAAAKQGLQFHAYDQGMVDLKTGARIWPKSEREVLALCGYSWLEPCQRK